MLLLGGMDLWVANLSVWNLQLQGQCTPERHCRDPIATLGMGRGQPWAVGLRKATSGHWGSRCWPMSLWSSRSPLVSLYL